MTPTQALNGVRILVVDDEPDNLDFLVFFLEDIGATVLGVDSAAGAIAALPDFSPTLLISDIGMPDMDGYELIRHIRQLPADQGGQIPAIALTAYAGEIDKRRAVQAGYRSHLAKPVQVDELAAMVQAISGE